MISMFVYFIHLRSILRNKSIERLRLLIHSDSFTPFSLGETIYDLPRPHRFDALSTEGFTKLAES